MKKKFRVMTDASLLSINSHMIDDCYFYSLSYNNERFSCFLDFEQAEAHIESIQKKIASLTALPAYYPLSIPAVPNVSSNVRWAQAIQGKSCRTIIVCNELFEMIELFHYHPSDMDIDVNKLVGMKVSQAIIYCLEEEKDTYGKKEQLSLSL